MSVLTKEISSTNALGQEVETLIRNQFSWDATGEADMVIDALASELEGMSSLNANIADHIMNFTSEVSSPLVALNLEVSDSKPDDIAHDPNKIILYESAGQVTNGMLMRTMRSTISGTRTSVSNMSDIDAYMSANKKHHLVLCLGSFRADDLTALDTDFDMLIDTLSAMGIADDVIEEMVALLISGDAPPALVEAAGTILAVGQVQDVTELPALLQKLETSLVESVAQSKSIKIASIVTRIKESLQPVVRSEPASLMPQIKAFQAGDAPKLSERLSTLKIITNVVKTTADLIKQPDLPKAEKDQLTITLASLRANILNPTSKVFNQVFVKLTNQVVPIAESVAPKSTIQAREPQSIAVRAMNVLQAVTKASLVLMPMNMRQALPIAVASPEKPSSTLKSILPASTSRAVIESISKPAIDVSSNLTTTYAVPLALPKAVLQTVSVMEIAPTTPSRDGFTQTMTNAHNDNQDNQIVMDTPSKVINKDDTPIIVPSILEPESINTIETVVPPKPGEISTNDKPHVFDDDKPVAPDPVDDPPVDDLPNDGPIITPIFVKPESDLVTPTATPDVNGPDVDTQFVAPETPDSQTNEDSVTVEGDPKHENIPDESTPEGDSPDREVDNDGTGEPVCLTGDGPCRCKDKFNEAVGDPLSPPPIYNPKDFVVPIEVVKEVDKKTATIIEEHENNLALRGEKPTHSLPESQYASMFGGDAPPPPPPAGGGHEFSSSDIDEIIGAKPPRDKGGQPPPPHPAFCACCKAKPPPPPRANKSNLSGAKMPPPTPN